MDETQAVKAAARRFHRAQRTRDATMRDLADAIEAAVAAGVPKLRVADAAGVTRQTVYDILERHALRR